MDSNRIRDWRRVVWLGPALAVALLWLGMADPPEAPAASCQSSAAGFFAGDVTIAGRSCSDLDEVLRVYCGPSSILVDYAVEGGPTGTDDSGIACAAARRLRVFGNEGDDVIDASGVRAESGFTGLDKVNLLDGGTGDDRLLGGRLADAAVGGGGDDLIRGGEGNDSGRGGAGADTIQGDAGNDAVLGEGGVDLLRGGTGADKLIGGAASDLLLGGAGADSLFGGAAADLLVGGGGRDSLNGGPGADVERQ